MSRQDIVLIGAGGHCRSCIDAIESEGRWRIAAIVGQAAQLGSSILGYPIDAVDADLSALRQRFAHALVTVGQIDSAALRMRLFQDALALGFNFPVVKASSAYVSAHASLGAGTLVAHGAIVNAGAKIGENCIVNSRALIEHDATIGSHCHISTGAVLNGNVHVGDGSFIGSAAVVRESVQLGQQCFVAMGMRVSDAVPAFSRISARTQP
jgi:acetyltransferase-like isoleucine patch superfamily enzyme